MKKTRGKLHFFNFSENFWSTGSKNDEKWKKNEKKWKKNEKNWGKIAIFHFLENCNFPRVCFSFFFIFFSHFFFIFLSFFIIFHHFSSIPPLEAKMIKKWKNSRKIAFFLFFGKFLEHWKQKWWNMIKKWKKMKKTRGKLQFSIF